MRWAKLVPTGEHRDITGDVLHSLWLEHTFRVFFVGTPPKKSGFPCLSKSRALKKKTPILAGDGAT